MDMQPTLPENVLIKAPEAPPPVVASNFDTMKPERETKFELSQAPEIAVIHQNFQQAFNLESPEST